ncbi:branched-chain amino acid aminotransferase [Companilactobacillus ginsenosidimutans]|uniref:Branched-chain-amino-acid aminotransferase n=1 Tax=Companilactobacillus ginsenosidimutans TaxID=1007676 RepID=A0A0H4QLI6_9LACO|nr:branched-chain amino acid aminotransferase [Companilactobacillus ginsenosidimutans]AKP67941.1 branched-chain amino acid aminotransferase [Companilactobacillus ginsenosidimutans]
MAKADASKLDWNNLGFEYMDLPYRFTAHWKDGKWQDAGLTEDATLHISEASPVLHYGQAAFEGMKAYRTPDNHIQLFRPDRNAARLRNSCERLLMPVFPEDKFVDAVKEVVKANADFVPPYGNGATMYLRPLIIGTGGVIGVHAAPEYIFTIFAMPVGNYFKGGLTPVNFTTSQYDRAAHKGTGQAKVGGNYAASLLPGEKAHDNGYADCVYLDPVEHRYIEEVGSANFFGITKDNVFKTPKSPSILPSITKYSLLYLAEHNLGLGVSEEKIDVHDLDQFAEAGACGTAAVISPIGGLEHDGNLHTFYSETEVGPVTKKLYDTLTGIQFGTVEAPEGWVQTVE